MRLWHYYCVFLLVVSPFAGVVCARWQRPSVRDYMKRFAAERTAGRMAEAERILRHVLARDRTNSVARVRLAELFLRQEDLSNAIKALEPIPDSDPLACGARLTEGDAWFQLNHLAQAESSWLRARQIDEDHPSVRFWLIHLYGVQLRWASWRAMLWAEYDRGLAGLEEMVHLMNAGLEIRNFSVPLARLRFAVAADSSDLNTRRALGLHLLRQGNLQEGYAEIAALCRDNPDDPEAWFAMVDCHIARGDTESLAEWLADAPAALSQDRRLWYAHGSLALLQNRPGDAVRDYRRALHEAPYAMNVHIKMVEAMRRCDDPESLRPHLEITKVMAKIEQLVPMLHTNGWDLDLISQLVSACEKLLLIEEAQGWVEVGLTRAPDNDFLLESRARLSSGPITSSRKPPTWESLEQSFSW